MKVAISGATGFLGGVLARALLERGYEVHGLARVTSDLQRLSELPLQWHPGDITVPETLPPWIEDADYVIHAAGVLGRTGIEESTYRRVNEWGAVNVFSAAMRLARPPRVLHVSTAGVVGPMPNSAADDLWPDETWPLAPSNAYERSKAYAEKAIPLYVRQGLPLIVARPEFVYGPEDYHVLGLFQAIQQGQFFYIGDGHNTCHPTYIDDAVEGMLLCLFNGQPGEIYNVAGSNPVTWREFAPVIAAELGVPPPRWQVPRRLVWMGTMGLEWWARLRRRQPVLSRNGVAFFSQSRRSSWAKAREELGFKPQIDLAEGVRQAVAWYRQRRLL